MESWRKCVVGDLSAVPLCCLNKSRKREFCKMSFDVVKFVLIHSHQKAGSKPVLCLPAYLCTPSMGLGISLVRVP